MVTILRRLVKEVLRFSKESRILIPVAMAWRSIGSDNADLINQLEGTFLYNPNTKNEGLEKNIVFFD